MAIDLSSVINPTTLIATAITASTNALTAYFVVHWASNIVKGNKKIENPPAKTPNYCPECGVKLDDNCCKTCHTKNQY